MDTKTIYHSSRELTGQPSHKKLALYSIGAVVIANILLLLVDSLMRYLIQDATGLTALGKRAMLQTVTSALQLALNLAAPFWAYGFTKVAMDIARQGNPTPDTLLTGFRRFWPLLRYLILVTIIGISYFFLSTMIGTMLFMLSPMSDQAMLAIEPALAQAETAALANDPEALNALMGPLMAQLLQRIWPMYLLIAIALCVILLPWLYQIRLTPYHILDGDNKVLFALAKSRHEMYGKRFSMFLLDLRFWWYYALLLIASVPLYVYSFTGGGQLAMWGLTLLSLGLQLLVQWQFLPRVETAYALAYDQLRIKEEP